MSIIVIPAFNPGNKLIEIVQNIMKLEKYEVIVVNDGSFEESVFNQIRQDVTILSHDKNYGKGVAIKTALQYIKHENKNGKILIMDSDGQHRIQDGIKLLEELDIKKKEIIIGRRNFKHNIPLKSKVGNAISRFMFKIFSGKDIYDTQTGLRAFNSNIIDMLLNIEGDRYEYETNMLIQCAKKKIEIREIDIETIYEHNNTSSYYRPITDSLRIGVIFLKSKLLILLLLLVLSVLMFCGKINIADSSTSNNVLTVNLISDSVATQGDVIVYKIENTEHLDIYQNISVEIINSKEKKVGKATIKCDKILVDTSMLPAGKYNIKVKYNSNEMIVKDYFKVILIRC